MGGAAGEGWVKMSVAGVSLSPAHTEVNSGEVRRQGTDGRTDASRRWSHPEPAATPPGLLSLLRRTNSWDKSSRSCREIHGGWGGEHRAVGSWLAGTGGPPHLLQVHVLGQLLLQHVLQLLVHLAQVLISRLHQVPEHRAQAAPLALGGAVAAQCAARHVWRGRRVELVSRSQNNCISI